MSILNGSPDLRRGVVNLTVSNANDSKMGKMRSDLDDI